MHINSSGAPTLYSQAPYAYAYNNPLRFIDIEGRDPGDIVVVFAGADLFSTGGKGVTEDIVDGVNNRYIKEKGGRTRLSMYFIRKADLH